MKKLLSTLMICVLLVSSLGLTAFASAPNVGTTEIPVVEFESYNEYIGYLENLDVDDDTGSTRGDTILTAGVIRDGSSDDCELYIYWTGDELFNAFRYKSVTVKSTSLLFPTTYKTFGDGSKYTTINVTGSAVGSFKVGDLEIDSDVTKVKVSSSGLGGYKMLSSSWHSAAALTGTVTIN